MFLLLRPALIFEVRLESGELTHLTAGPIFAPQTKIQPFVFISKLVDFALCRCNLAECVDVLLSEREDATTKLLDGNI